MDIVEGKPKRGRWRSALRWVLCLGVIWLVYQEAMACLPWYFARQIGQSYPGLSVVPGPLKDMRVSPLKGMQIERYDCSFQVPWTELASAKDAKTVALMSFKAGGSLTFFDPKATVASLQLIRPEIEKKGMNFEGLFGREMARSNYDFAMAAARITPNQIRLIDSRRSNARDIILLTIKLSESPRSGDAFYEVQQGEMRGLQIGDPSVAPFNVQLELFDTEDRLYTVWLGPGKDANSPVMTQAEINGIIRSMHGSREKLNSHSNASTTAELRFFMGPS